MLTNDILQYDKVYKSKELIYTEYHGGCLYTHKYSYLLLFSNNGLMKIGQHWDYQDLKSVLLRLKAKPYKEDCFYQLDESEIKFILNDHEIEQIFNGKVMENKIVGSYVNLLSPEVEVFELISEKLLLNP